MLPNRKRSIHLYIHKEYEQESVKYLQKWERIEKKWQTLKIIGDFH